MGYRYITVFIMHDQLITFAASLTAVWLRIPNSYPQSIMNSRDNAIKMSPVVITIMNRTMLVPIPYYEYSLYGSSTWVHVTREKPYNSSTISYSLSTIGNQSVQEFAVMNLSLSCALDLLIYRGGHAVGHARRVVARGVRARGRARPGGAAR
eukprot:COSAG02_NODE_13656_length_1364_cov_1.771113_2_plen_151_part_01